MQYVKGAIHLHTTLSHDGTLSLEQLAGFLKSHGYGFIAITEHSYDIDKTDIQNLVTQSKELSSPDFLIIPGIEFRCHDDIDILGYGVIETCDSDDPATVIGHIHKHGGVAVFAHPTVRLYPVERSWVELLDGAELWNVQEGKYLPQLKTIRRFREFNSWHPGIKAFCGLDLHRTKSFYPMSTNIELEEIKREPILQALKDGKFKSITPAFSVGSDGELSAMQMPCLYLGRAVIDSVRAIRNIIRP